MVELYEPAEDSFLMIECLGEKISDLASKNPDLKVLEMGCGSGIILSSIKDLGAKKENILGVDVNPRAVEKCESFGFECLESDLFSKVPAKKFDVIVFNPPYLPLDENEPEESRRETTGGRKGNETIINFLEQAKDFLTERGKIFLITSSLASPTEFDKLGYEARNIGTKKLFFEELACWEVSIKE